MTTAAERYTETDTNSTDGLRRSLGHAWLIARIEIRRSYRQMMNDRHQLVGFAISGLFLLMLVAGAIGGAYVLGTTVGTDAFLERLPLARTAVAGMAIIVAFIATIGTLQTYGELEEPTPVLTAVPYREAVWGVLLTNYLSFTGFAALPILAVALAFAVGSGSLVSIPVITGVLLAVVVFATTAGFVLGQLIKLVTIRVAFVARYKTLIGVLAFVAYFALFATGAFEALFGVDWTVLGATPLGWVTDLALVAIPSSSIGITRPIAATVTLLAGTTLLTWLAVRLSGALWYSDPVRPENEADAPDTGGDRIATASDTPTKGLSERLFGGRVSRPTLRIAQKSWRRAYRAPLKLQFAAWPVFCLIAPVQQSFETGEVSTILPISIAIYGAWATGAAFTLNPLGDEGAVLPLTLLSGVRGTQLLRGLVFAGVALGGPVIVLFTVGLGLASPMGVFPALVAGAFGAVLCTGACAIGAGVGTAFPKFERTRLSRSRTAIVPSIWAFSVYSLVLLVVSLPGLFASVPLLADWLAGQIGVSTPTIALAGLAVTTVLASVAAGIALHSAATTIDGYTPTR
jgi:ABC-2 type transport system permease protein